MPRGKKQAPLVHAIELVDVDELKPHSQNYRGHPDDQREHLAESIRENGFYRNVVVARDLTILAGHGVVESARDAGATKVPVVKLDLDPDEPRALKILTGDNEIARLAEVDDRALTELLRSIRDSAVDVGGLVGTGFDDAMLANLVFVTRTEDEIRTGEDAALWVGLPEFEADPSRVRLIVAFESADDRAKLMKKIGATLVNKNTRGVWSIWWPEKQNEADRSKTTRFVEGKK